MIYNVLVRRFSGRWVFVPGSTTQAQEVILSKKTQTQNHPTIYLTKTLSLGQIFQNTLVFFLDTQLDFKEHPKNTFNRANKNFGLLRKFQKLLSRISLLAVYKSFIRYLIGYGEVIYDQTCNASVPFITQKLHFC